MRSKQDIIAYKLLKFEETWKVSELTIENELWGSATSELYYCCFYLIQALFIKYDIETSTHAGTKSQFGLHFIKTGIVEEKWSAFLSTLFTKRQKSDYDDFVVITKEEILEIARKVQGFKKVITDLLNK